MQKMWTFHDFSWRCRHPPEFTYVNRPRDALPMWCLKCVDSSLETSWNEADPEVLKTRHSAGSTNYEEIATYDNMQNPQLLAKPYSGHEYSYTDSMVPPGGALGCSAHFSGHSFRHFLPGKYDYRLLCRSRDGGITAPGTTRGFYLKSCWIISSFFWGSQFVRLHHEPTRAFHHHLSHGLLPGSCHVVKPLYSCSV